MSNETTTTTTSTTTPDRSGTLPWTKANTLDSTTIDHTIGVPGAMVGVRVHIMRAGGKYSLRAYEYPTPMPVDAEIAAKAPGDYSDARLRVLARMMAQQLADLAGEVRG